MKFMLNAFLDTFPTKSNLIVALGEDNNCALCSNKETLQHVLDNGKTMLDQGRYTWRQNFVLRIIMTPLNLLKDVRNQSWSFYCNLAGLKNADTIVPPDILPTQQRPDLVLINEISNSIIIIELTITFEQNIHKDHEHNKLNKYASPISELQEQSSVS